MQYNVQRVTDFTV